MFIYLRPEFRLCLSQLLSLYGEKLGSQYSLEEMLVSLEASALILLIFLISRRKPYFLAMLYIILFCFLRDFQILLPFVFRLLMLLHSMSPTSNGYSHSILDGTFGAHAGAILSTMRYILALRHSCLLAKHTVTLHTMVPVMLPSWGLVRA